MYELYNRPFLVRVVTTVRVHVPVVNPISHAADFEWTGDAYGGIPNMPVK